MGFYLLYVIFVNIMLNFEYFQNYKLKDEEKLLIVGIIGKYCFIKKEYFVFG